MARSYVALGANLGDPVATVKAALAALPNLPETTLVRHSSLYRTAPVGLLDQPDFFNAVAALDTALAPEELLDALLQMEADFGRLRREKDGPRSLDLDLLLYEDRVLASSCLTLPHPRMHLRAFVMVPLVEIAPDILLPGRGRGAAWLPAVAMQGIHRLPA